MFKHFDIRRYDDYLINITFKERSFCIGWHYYGLEDNKPVFSIDCHKLHGNGKLAKPFKFLPLYIEGN